MLKRILRHIRREPLPPLVTLLFAAVLSVLLCTLRQTQITEQENYERSFASVPVYFTVVDLDGTAPDDKITGWAAELFYPESKLEPNFSGSVKDLELKMQYSATSSSGKSMTVSGANSLRLLPELSEHHGGSITWLAGYNESIFSSNEYVCLVPEGFSNEKDIELGFIYEDTSSFAPKKWSTTEQFTIAGYTSSRDKIQIYIPYQTMGKILSKIHAPYALTGIGATLNDNTRLTELQEVADQWFARPNINGTLTAWGRYDHDYFPYALDINDTLLQQLDATMERSMRINRLSAFVIFCIAAAAGFLAGFLVIRTRKRDLILMRTLGCSHRDIFLELTAEQALCVLTGVLLGGSYRLWLPLGQLALFLFIYCVGLCTAMLIYLRTNLLATIKEDE